MSEHIKCQECAVPVARIDGLNLVIEARHHGAKHTTIVSLGALMDGILREAAQRAAQVENLSLDRDQSGC